MTLSILHYAMLVLESGNVQNHVYIFLIIFIYSLQKQQCFFQSHPKKSCLSPSNNDMIVNPTQYLPIFLARSIEGYWTAHLPMILLQLAVRTKRSHARYTYLELPLDNNFCLFRKNCLLGVWWFKTVLGRVSIFAMMLCACWERYPKQPRTKKTA